MPRRKTNNEVRKILEADSEYEIIEPFNYINSRTVNIHMKHKVCGQDFYVSLDHWTAGRRPHRCSTHKTTLRKTTDEFKAEVKACPNSDDYEVVGEYVNKRAKIKMLHVSKQHIFEISPEDFLDGCRCSICNGTHLKTTEEFRKEVSNITNDYEVVGEYVGALTKIKMKHIKCGKTFMMRPNDFLSSEARCPYCMVSKNEEKIKQLLTEHNIEFLQQYKFSDCKDKKLLKFDFYIPSKNTCIEYDGEYHYKDVYGQLKGTLRRDAIKTKYCADHGIKLIRISYKEKEKINDLIHMLS